MAQSILSGWWCLTCVPSPKCEACVIVTSIKPELCIIPKSLFSAELRYLGGDVHEAAQMRTVRSAESSIVASASAIAARETFLACP